MLARLFPKTIDNTYRGHPIALWLFYPLVLVNVAIAVVAIVRADGGAQSADGIPLDTFPVAAATTIIGIGAFLGLAKLLLGSLYTLAALRYRAMIPLMYALIVTDLVGRKILVLYKPIARMAGTATGSYVTWTLFALSVIGLVLSLWPARAIRQGA